MKKVIRNWKIAMRDVDTKTALEVLKNQVLNVSRSEPIHGPFTIQSMKTRKVLDYYDPTICLRCDEATDLWYILVPDDDKERQKVKIIELAKESNATGLKHDKLEHMSIGEIWEYITEHFDDDIKYKMLKWYFESKVYSKNPTTNKDKKKATRVDTGFVDAFGNHIYEGDIFVYKKYLPFKDEFGKRVVPDDLISNWSAYKNVVCLHPVFFDDEKHCWASDVYSDADPMSSFDANEIVVVTNNIDHPKLYNH